MKRAKFIKLRATTEERDRWNEAAEKVGKPLSAIIREHMEKVCEKVTAK